MIARGMMSTEAQARISCEVFSDSARRWRACMVGNDT